MPKLIRIILHVLQFGALLTGLGYALSYVLINEGAWSGIRSATLDQPYGAIIFGIIAVALSPSLWSSRREGQGPFPPNVGHMTGSYDAVPAAPPSSPSPAPQSGNVDPSSAPSVSVASSGPQGGPRPPVMAPASGPVAQPPAPPQGGAAVPPQQPPGGAVPQAGTGYPTDTNPGMTQSQFAPRPGEPGGPPATDNSPPNSTGTLQNPKSPWS